MEGYTANKEFSKVLEHTQMENFDERKYQVYRVANNGLLYFGDTDS